MKKTVDYQKLRGFNYTQPDAANDRVFWAEYVGRTVCEKYECCVIQKKLAHCGKCGELPCRRYDLDDPNLSPEENKRIREENIKLLRSLQ